jgi:hypothetical protein
MRHVLSAIVVLAISGCTAPHAHRQTTPSQPVVFSPPAWLSPAAIPAATEEDLNAPAAKLELVQFHLARDQARATTERLGLTSGPAVLTDEQFAHLIEAAEKSAGGFLVVWPSVEVQQAASLEIGRGNGKQVLRGTAWYLRACDVTSDSAKVQFAVQHIDHHDNWAVEGVEQLQTGQAVAQLVTAADEDTPVQGIAVRLASIEEAVN